MRYGTQGVVLTVGIWAVLAGAGCNGRKYVMTGDPVVARSRALTTLNRAARDSDNFTRAKAIEAMVGVLGAQGGQAYISALDDPAPNVRFSAAMAVGDLKYAPALPRVLAMARYKQPGAERQWSVYCGVIYAMHRLGRPEQTGRLERGLLGFYIGFRKALFGREFFIADDSIDPVVRHLDFQFVVLGLDGLRDLDPPGRRPDNTEILPVQGYPGDTVHLAKVEVNGLFP